jgi:hypothetical protein
LRNRLGVLLGGLGLTRGDGWAGAWFWLWLRRWQGGGATGLFEQLPMRRAWVLGALEQPFGVFQQRFALNLLILCTAAARNAIASLRLMRLLMNFLMRPDGSCATTSCSSMTSS